MNEAKYITVYLDRIGGNKVASIANLEAKFTDIKKVKRSVFGTKMVSRFNNKIFTLLEEHDTGVTKEYLQIPLISEQDVYLYVETPNEGGMFVFVTGLNSNSLGQLLSENIDALSKTFS